MPKRTFFQKLLTQLENELVKTATKQLAAQAKKPKEQPRFNDNKEF